jgi:hypothetical protein
MMAKKRERIPSMEIEKDSEYKCPCTEVKLKDGRSMSSCSTKEAHDELQLQFELSDKLRELYMKFDLSSEAFVIILAGEMGRFEGFFEMETEGNDEAEKWLDEVIEEHRQIGREEAVEQCSEDYVCPECVKKQEDAQSKEDALDTLKFL